MIESPFPRVFVSEFVCGGAWPEPEIDGSLAVEGRAMLLALVDDLLRVPGSRVVTSWDARLGAFPRLMNGRLRVIPVRSLHEEAAVFAAECRAADFSFVIAPEFHGILRQRVAIAEACGTLIGCSPRATALCSDKLELAQQAQRLGITTIETALFDPRQPAAAFPFPLVVKPRDGAGSTDTFQADSELHLQQISTGLLESGGGFDMIQQPLIRGLPCSTAALIDRQSRRLDILPPGEQLISSDGRFRYLGADLPGRVTPSQRQLIEAFIQRCVAVWPGLSGYVGFDLLLLDAPSDVGSSQSTGLKPPRSSVVLVEINPRFTTTYLAWRSLTECCLAARLLPGFKSDSGIVWRNDAVTFRLDRILDRCEIVPK